MKKASQLAAEQSLRRFASNSMYSLHIECDADQLDLLSAELWEAGTVGIRELSYGVIASF